MVALGLALIAVIAQASPAAAVTGGQPDNGAHPQVALILADLADGSVLCSGSLIAPSVVLTAAHCTDFFDSAGVREVRVSFDDQVTANSTFYTSRRWRTHPGYVATRWPFTIDVGVVILRQSVGLQPASLPPLGILDTLIPDSGAANDQRFVDVGYGQTGVTTGGGPPQAAFPLQRRRSTQTYHPGRNDMVGVTHGMSDLLLMLKANPSSRHGSGCGGDSGGPIFRDGTFTIVAIHTGGYRLGFDGQLCGRLSSLNHRVDTAAVLNWLSQFVR
jgi:secreted trypsin-like serine protease